MLSGHCLEVLFSVRNAFGLLRMREGNFPPLKASQRWHCSCRYDIFYPAALLGLKDIWLDSIQVLAVIIAYCVEIASNMITICCITIDDHVRIRDLLLTTIFENKYCLVVDRLFVPWTSSLFKNLFLEMNALT